MSTNFDFLYNSEIEHNVNKMHTLKSVTCLNYVEFRCQCLMEHIIMLYNYWVLLQLTKSPICIAIMPSKIQALL